MSQICDTDGLIRAHIVRSTRLPSLQHFVEPFSKVALIQVRPKSCPITADGNQRTLKCVADEISNREMHVHREIASYESKTSGNDYLKTVLVGIEATQVLGRPLRDAIGVS